MTTKGLVPNSRCSKALISQCISTYSKVVAEVYKRKLRPNTLQQALDDDEWRYTELPSQLSPIKKDTCLTKDDITRLVRWKITHGVYRPFLPAQVQKNDKDAVQDSTTATVKLLMKLKIKDEGFDECVMDALKEVTKLKGVGPATGSLVLSVLARDTVVFFQDELFGWLFPTHPKLKYDVKEYRMLLQKCQELMKTYQVNAWELEKAAYVLMHHDVLTDQQKRVLTDVAGSKDEAGQDAEGGREDIKGDDLPKQESSGSGQGKARSAKAKAATKLPKRTISPDDENYARKSKRKKE